MNKGLLEIYALSVCFVSVGCLSIFGGIFLFSLVELAFPTSRSFPPVHYPPPIYGQQGVGSFPVPFNQQLSISDDNRLIDLPKESTQKRVKQQKQFEKIESERMRARDIKGITRYFIIIFIASIVFTLHWRMAKQARIDDSL